MEKRASRRRPVRLQARLFWGKTVYPGIVTSLSENGMFICTRMSPPYNSVLEAVLHINKKILKVPVNVKWTVSIGDPEGHNDNSGIGVELLDVPLQYLKLLKDL